MDDILRLLQLGGGGGSTKDGRCGARGGDYAAEPLVGHASADGAGGCSSASSWLHELDVDDDFLISREAHQPSATACTAAAAAAAAHTEPAQAWDKGRPRISFANALPPRPPAGEPVRQSTAQLGR
jgi:hypothetical protein